jgi:two-component system, chemotaxis family, protein-glutamate methylesterase/glutaminase
MPPNAKIRILVIDDSAYNRMTLTEIFESQSDMTVIGKACDGEEGLEKALKEKPDVITLDLEMPRMGGFPFLRILLSKITIPVIVISSHNEPEKVFRALELGALDFVAKPSKTVSPTLKQISKEVIDKVRMASGVIQGRAARAQFPNPPKAVMGKSITPRSEATEVVGIAASTGGPQALTKVLTALPEELEAGILVVQHMPPGFTTNFAERLDKLCKIRVIEPRESTRLHKGTAYIAPGDKCLELVRDDVGLVVSVMPPDGSERIVPSADRLFLSMASAGLQRQLGIVLTGMGKDGSLGVKPLTDSGGVVVVEDETTAVVPGMPRAAALTGAVQQSIPLNRIADFVIDFFS